MRNLKKGQHIFIAFQSGKAVLDSQLRPRIYTSLENADRWTPTVNKGKIEYVEYAPALTPQNEPLTIEQLREMDGEPVWVTPLGFWALVIAKPGKRVQLMSNDGETVWADKEIELVGPVFRRQPERQEDTNA